jgi:hypothetical protein
MAAHGGTRRGSVPGSGRGSGESWRKGMAATGLSGPANGPKGQAAWSTRWQFQGKIKLGCQGHRAEFKDGLHKLFLEFRQGFWIKNLKDSNTFKLNLNWGQTWINLNKLFKYFLNLELFEIDLNNQI